MRHVVGGRASQPEKPAASTSEVGRFETGILSTKSNLTALLNLSGRWIDTVQQRRPLKELILDLDSSVSETYGKQQGTAYNGHFECLCYHPLFLFNQFGDLERVLLPRGNKASAKYWRRVLLPVIERYRHLSLPKFFRGDAGWWPRSSGTGASCSHEWGSSSPISPGGPRTWSSSTTVAAPPSSGSKRASTP